MSFDGITDARFAELVREVIYNEELSNNEVAQQVTDITFETYGTEKPNE